MTLTLFDRLRIGFAIVATVFVVGLWFDRTTPTSDDMTRILELTPAQAEQALVLSR